MIFLKILVVDSLCCRLDICAWKCCIFAFTECQLSIKYLRKDKAKLKKKKTKKRNRISSKKEIFLCCFFFFLLLFTLLPTFEAKKPLTINIATNTVTNETTEEKLRCKNTTKNILQKKRQPGYPV